MLWASALLPSAQLRGFEPLPLQAAAFQRAARGRVRVEHLALRDSKGVLDIGFPSHSMALATFQSCREQYERPSNFELQCISKEVKAETLDALIEDRIDLLKVHVQGDELSVLHGANVSFATQRICALLLNLEHSYLIPGSARMVANLMRKSGFVAVLVNIWDVRPASFPYLRAAMVRRQPFWRRGHEPPAEEI